jgi:hypothetical protein
MTTDQYLALLDLRFDNELERTFYLKTINLLKALTDCPLIEAHYALSPHIQAIWHRAHERMGDHVGMPRL